MKWIIFNEVFNTYEKDIIEHVNNSGIYIIEGKDKKGKLCRYVGKTIQNFRKRMNGYRKPGPSQMTNKRINEVLNIENNSDNIKICFIPIDRNNYSEEEYNKILSMIELRYILQQAAKYPLLNSEYHEGGNEYELIDIK